MPPCVPLEERKFVSKTHTLHEDAGLVSIPGGGFLLVSPFTHQPSRLGGKVP